MSVRMGAAEYAKLIYQIETQGSEKAKAAIAGVNAEVDKGTKSINQLTQATEKSTQASKLKINALDMLVGRFVLYTQAVLYAQMIIKAYDDQHKKMIESAVKGEEELTEKYRTLTKAIDDQKKSSEELQRVRGELLSDQHIGVLREVEARNVAIADAIKGQADNIQRMLGFKNEFAQFWYDLQTFGYSFDPKLRGAASEINKQFAGRSAPPSADEINRAVKQWMVANGYNPDSAQMRGYIATHVARGGNFPAPYVPQGPALGYNPALNNKLSQSQQDIAGQIIQYGRTHGYSDTDIQVALMAAAQESSFNPNASNETIKGRVDRGLFQMSPDKWAGAKPGDVTRSLEWFYSTLGSLRSKGVKWNGTRMDWDNATLSQMAQAVEGSAYPDAYAKHEALAASLIAGFGGNAGPALKPERVTKLKAPPTWDVGLGSMLGIRQKIDARDRSAQFGSDAGLAGFLAGIGAGGGGGFGLDLSGFGRYRGMSEQPSYALSGYGMRFMNSAMSSVLGARPGRGDGWNDLVEIYDTIIRDEGSGQPDTAYDGDVSVRTMGRHPEAVRRRIERNRRHRQNAYGAAGAFASGGFGGAASFGLDLLAPGLGSIGIPLVSKLFGGIFGGGKHKDVGLTPSNPVWTRNEVLEQQNRDLLNILVPTLAGQAAGRVQALFNQAAGQGGVINRTAGTVRAG